MAPISRTCRGAIRPSLKKTCFVGACCRMRPPEIRENSADLLELICDLIEAPRARIGANFLNARTSDVERLVTFGLVRRGSAPRTIACRACDEDHATTPEFDSVAGRYFHFCPVVGRVEIEPYDMKRWRFVRGQLSIFWSPPFPCCPPSVKNSWPAKPGTWARPS